MSEEKVIHTFQFKKSEDYKRIHATGFWGGIHPTGELYFDIYEDIFPLPSESQLIQDEKGIHEKVIGQKEVVERILHVGVTIPMAAVPSLIEWLKQKMEIYEKEFKNRQR